MVGLLEHPAALRAIVAGLALALATPAPAAVLYKSIERGGRITFSDTPVDGAIAVQRIQLSDDAKGAVLDAATSPLPSLADANDEAIARANAKLDAAEHALALARQLTSPPFDGLSLWGMRATRADRDRIEFYKRDVATARRDLMRLLKQRRYFAPPESTMVAAR